MASASLLLAAVALRALRAGLAGRLAGLLAGGLLLGLLGDLLGVLGVVVVFRHLGEEIVVGHEHAPHWFLDTGLGRAAAGRVRRGSAFPPHVSGREALTWRLLTRAGVWGGNCLRGEMTSIGNSPLRRKIRQRSG